MGLVLDQFRAVWALIRGSERWRSLLRTDSQAALAAIVVLVLSTWIFNVASNAFESGGGHALSDDIVLVAMSCLIPTFLAVLWGRREMALITAFASAWLAAAGCLVSALLIPPMTLSWTADPGESSLFVVLALLICGVAVLLIAAWTGYRVVRTLLTLSRAQAALFIALEFFFLFAALIGADLTFGTSFILTDEVRASFDRLES